MSNYRRADRKTQWFQGRYPGANLRLTPETMVMVLHTTEGTSWPSYGGGATAPNYTYKPGFGSQGKWRAHFPDEKSSRALRNLSGGVETNTLNSLQVELIGTCDPTKRKTWGPRVAGRDYVYWPDATTAQLREVAEFIADLHKRHGLKLRAPKKFLPYPSSYGNSSVRMSFSEWRKATGVVGHQHVPENSHGDPGDIPIERILKMAQGMVKKSKPKPKKGKRKKDLPTRNLVALHASMQVHDSPKQKAQDVRTIFEHAKKVDASWITGTEAGAGDEKALRNLLKSLGPEYGYKFWMDPRQDSWIAVRQRFIYKGWRTKYKQVLAGHKGKHTAKGVHWVSFRTRDMGRFTIYSGHLLTRGRPGAKNKEYRRHIPENTLISEAISRSALWRGRGARKVFYGGDQNILGKTGYMFLGFAPFIACWAERDKYPKTHGAGNIDVIARSVKDNGVKCVRARRYTDRELFLHTDHLLVEAEYQVTLKRKKSKR